MADLDTFLRGCDDAKERAVRAVVQAQKMVAIDAYHQICADSMTVNFEFGSPVWSGRFMGSNTIAIGEADTSTLPPHPDTQGPGAERWEAPGHPIQGAYHAHAMSEAVIKLAALEPFQKVVIANALPYARRIEDGYSKLKAPAGVYEVTAASMRTKYGHIRLSDLDITVT